MNVRLGQCCSRLLHVQLEESWQKSEIRFARKIHAARYSSKSKQVQRESLIHVDQSNTKSPENKEELLKILKSNICSHKDGLLVIAKPPGVSVNTGRTDAVSVTEVVPQLAEVCNLPFLEIVKAPEKESSGSLLMATDIEKLNELRNSWKIAGVNHSIRRKFLAVTIGIPEPEAGTICQALKYVSIGDHLLTVPVRNVSLKSIKSGHAKKATTEYRVLSKNEDLNYALLEILEIQVDKLRHHQLQDHLGQKMCKILGDHLYSSRVRCILGRNVTANPQEVTPRTQPIVLNAQVYTKSKGIIQREYQDGAVLYTAYAPNPFTSMSEREILDYKKEIADKTGQDVKEIELIVQAEETEIKETKEESEDGEKIRTQKITTKTVTIHGDQPGTVETTTVSILNGEKEDNDDRAPSPTPDGSQSVEGFPSKDSSLLPTKKKKKFRTPSFLSKKKKDKKAES